MSVTISFRVDDEIPKGLERQGENPHEVAREAFLEAVQRRKREAAFERLIESSKEPEESVKDSIRRGRT